MILSFSYEERYKALETITQNLQEPATFEDFCAQLCCPGVPVPTGGSSGNLSGKPKCLMLKHKQILKWKLLRLINLGSFFNTMDLPANPSSGPPSSSGGHVTFSSDTSYGFPASIFRHNSGQDKQRGMSFFRHSLLNWFWFTLLFLIRIRRRHQQCWYWGTTLRFAQSK